MSLNILFFFLVKVVQSNDFSSKTLSIKTKNSFLNVKTVHVSEPSKPAVTAPSIVNFASTRNDPIVTGYVQKIFSKACNIGLNIKDDEFSSGCQIDAWSVDNMLKLLRDELSSKNNFFFVSLAVEPDFLAPTISSYSRFGTIHYFPGHFIASVADFTRNELIIYDSLLPVVHSPERISSIKFFWENVFSNPGSSILFSKLKLLKLNIFKGPLQNFNDCGPNSIFFLINYCSRSFSIFDQYCFKQVPAKYSLLMRASIFYELQRINKK